jgi:hypothetical protein
MQQKHILGYLLVLILLTHCAALNPFGGSADTASEASEDPNKSENGNNPPRFTWEINESLKNSLKKRIVVLNFHNRTPFGGKELGENAAASVKESIARMPDLVIVNEEDINQDEIITFEDGKYNMKQVFEKARARGVSAIITGSINDVQIQERGDEIGLFRTRYHSVKAKVKFQLYDAGNEKLLLSKDTSAEAIEEHTRFLGSRTIESYDAARADSAVSKAIDRVIPLVSQYMKRIAWVGRIIKIDMNRYFINAGEPTGITVGQLLKVFGPGEPVIDDDAQQFMGMAPGRFKGILKVVDYFGTDGAVAVIHAGAGFQEKDRVEVYSPPRP